MRNPQTVGFKLIGVSYLDGRDQRVGFKLTGVSYLDGRDQRIKHIS